MRKISLTRGKTTLVDDETYEFLNQFKWHCLWTKDGDEYACSCISGKTVYMHRLLLGLVGKSGKIYGDHINGNGLDNRMGNLRISNNQLNQANSKLPRNSTSGYKGVTWHKQNKIWTSQIMVNGKHISLGCYKDKKTAFESYKGASKKYFGDFARAR